MKQSLLTAECQPAPRPASPSPLPSHPSQPPPHPLPTAPPGPHSIRAGSQATVEIPMDSEGSEGPELRAFLFPLLLFSDLNPQHLHPRIFLEHDSPAMAPIAHLR